MTTTAKGWSEPEETPATAANDEAHEGEVLEGAEWPAKTQVIKYSVTKAEIKAKLAEFESIDFGTPEGYDKGRKAIALCVTTRTAIEEKRVELKAPSLTFGRKVDAYAKELTGLISPTEEGLVAKRKVVDDEKARVRAEKEALEKAERDRLEREEREAREKVERERREAEQAELDQQRAELDEQRRKLEADKKAAEEAAEEARKARELEEAAEQRKREQAARAEQDKRDEAARLEREKQDAERRRIAKEQDAERERLAAISRQQDEERRKLEAERDELLKQKREEKEKAERLELERVTRERAERETRERIAKEQTEAEELKQRQEAAAVAEAARLEALRPDLVKVRAYAQTIREVTIPGRILSEAVAIALMKAEAGLEAVADELEAFASANEVK